MIEKGRHTRPRIEKSERYCFICKNEVEDEIHFVTKCPLYSDERIKLYNTCQNNPSRRIDFEHIPTVEQTFLFILNSKNPVVIKSFANFVYNCFNIRESAFSAQ